MVRVKKQTGLVRVFDFSLIWYFLSLRTKKFKSSAYFTQTHHFIETDSSCFILTRSFFVLCLQEEKAIDKSRRNWSKMYLFQETDTRQRAIKDIVAMHLVDAYQDYCFKWIQTIIIPSRFVPFMLEWLQESEVRKYNVIST